jgi:hypothetical protein
VGSKATVPWSNFRISFNMTRIALWLCLCGIIGPTAAFGGSVSFDFNTDGVLPSLQGAIYAVPGTPVPETAVYSASGGALHQNTVGYAAAIYNVINIYDPSNAATLEWRMQVDSATHGSVSMLFLSGTDDYAFWMRDDGVYYGPIDGSTRIAALDTRDAYHTYRMALGPNSSLFDFYVDGTLAFSGSGMNSIRATSALQWGDWSGFTDGGQAHWDYINWTNVPEPTSSVLLGIGMVTCAAQQWRRRKADVPAGKRQVR